MDTRNQSLLKIFSGILKKRISADANQVDISDVLIKYFSRKQLIEIITSIYNGSIPKEYNLLEMENKELLKVIADDMFIINYVTQKWCAELLEKRKEDKSEAIVSQKSKTNERGTTKTSKSN